MKIPFVSRLREASRGRVFRRINPDMHRVSKARALALRASSRNPQSSASTPLSPADIAHWNDLGFLILPGFYDQSVVDRYKHHVDSLWRARTRPDNPLVIVSTRGKHYFRDAIDADRLQTYRIMNHYLTDAPTRDLCMDHRLIPILQQLMGYAPVVCNTLLFEWGSEQDMHSDMFYMPPESENQMLATWIAIDEVTDDNGPLLYVPGSHKLPPHRFSHGKTNAVTDEVPAAVAATQEKLSELGLRPEKFLAKRGDVLIWHSQLFHGGAAIRDRSARRTSLVTHYLSTCDVGPRSALCAERKDGSLLLLKDHVPVG